DDVFDVARVPEKTLGSHLDADDGIRACELRLLPEPVERPLTRQVPGHSEGRQLADPAPIGGPAVVLPPVLDDGRAHHLRQRRQTGGLRERILLRAQIATEWRTRRGDPLETLFRSQRDLAASDALKIARRRLALVFVERCRSFPE